MGYRLDQHGGLIHIQEERKEAIKSTVLHVLSTCSSDQLFQDELLKRGIELRMSKEDYEVIGKELHKVLLYKDGKGKSISARELGPEFMLSGASRTIRANAQAEKDREAIAKSKIAYETTIAKSFAHHKGSATEFSKYLKGLKPTEIEEISRKVGRDQGVIGVEYVRHRLQADINKSELQLAGERDKLRREGYDIGKQRRNNLEM